MRWTGRRVPEEKKSIKEVKTRQDGAKFVFHYVFAPFPLHDNEQRGAAVTGQFWPRYNKLIYIKPTHYIKPPDPLH
ncbi:hypothetical protein F383_37315 [Gossypium arboreum]|uniref:Uncharacterized protein n=1 Tax=Gossypium arboreum TaxID=29729 RepID=A0A0B0MFG2_GOSAR|nr:hypothetical protein F383_37315 [Gossypium arboreum]